VRFSGTAWKNLKLSLDISSLGRKVPGYTCYNGRFRGRRVVVLRNNLPDVVYCVYMSKYMKRRQVCAYAGSSQNYINQKHQREFTDLKRYVILV
jgi:hypothetical protein